MMNKEFTITFWIRKNKNPKWKLNESEINFPPLIANNGAIVFFSKYGEKIKAYVLHPKLDYKKITANISEFLKEDTFVALTYSTKEAKLYINGKLIKTVKEGEKNSLEPGDYIMVQIESGDLNSIKGDKDVSVVLPVKVIEVNTENIKVQTFNPLEIVFLPRSRIIK